MRGLFYLLAESLSTSTIFPGVEEKSTFGVLTSRPLTPKMFQ
jgi:hypothetical protein